MGVSGKALPEISRADIDALLAHVGPLQGLQGRFLIEGDRLPDGATAMPWLLEYPELVVGFFQAAGEDPWNDYNYNPEVVGAMVRNRKFFAAASLDDVRTMLTWCVRGERFCDGHWTAVLDDGTVFALLDRLGAIRKEMGEG